MNANKTLSNGSYGFPEIIQTDARMYIVQSTACCRKCGDQSRVVTLAVNPEGSELPVGEFGFFLLFHIRRMPSSLVHSLQRYCPSYGLCLEDGLKMPYYRNRCVSCGDVFEEEDLVTSPGDAFHPYDETDYERIRIIDANYVLGYELRIEPEGDSRSLEGIKAAFGPEPELWDWYLNIQCE
jgi:hypothetical protein